jgi:hypothetical protein
MTEGLPTWLECVADRLEFLASQQPQCDETGGLATVLDALRRRAASPQHRDRVLQDFLRACLDELAAAARARSDLSGIRGELDMLCGLARTALDTDCDDRPLLARESALTALPGPAGWSAIRVPGRVVFLAAMVATLPDEECPAAVMLINDLAAVDFDMPLRALQAVVHRARG